MFYSTKPTFPDMIENVITYSAQNKWDKADKTLIKVEKKWNQDYSMLMIEFARLREAVNAKDVHQAKSEGKVCILLFKNITSISPNP